MGRTLLISFILFGLAMTSARADVMVIVRRQAEASGNYVRVCDIARLEGPKDQVKEVAQTVLGPTPGRGQALEITRWDIENRLFELGVAARVTFTGNDTVKVFGGGTGGRVANIEAVTLQSLDTASESAGKFTALNLEVPAERATEAPAVPVAKPGSAQRPESPPPLQGMDTEAREMLGKTISGYLAGRYPRKDIEVESKILSVTGAVPLGAHEVKVEEALGGRVPGKATLLVSVKETADAEPKRITVAADTEVYGLALVAGRQLFKNEVLSSRDVKVGRVRMDSGKSYLPPSVKAAEGRQLARTLKPGEAILASETQPTEAVKRGDIVETVTEGRGWQIAGNAKALAGGMIGDTIKVEVTGTKARCNARVTGRGRVTILVGNWRTDD